MSDPDPDPNPNPDLPKPPPSDGGWTGLPDVDWYQPDPQQQVPSGEPVPYVGGYGYYQGPQVRRAPLVNKPKSNLMTAILVTLFCCLPFGIVAIVYAAQVDSKWNAGDWHGAERASRSAKNWGVAGIVCGIIFSLLYVLLIASLDPSATQGGY